MIEVIAFPDLYRDHADMIVPEQVVRLTGTVDRGDKGTKLRGTKIEPLAELQNKGISRVMIRLHDSPSASTIADASAGLPKVSRLIDGVPGDGARWHHRSPHLPNVKITPSEHFVADIEEVLGKVPSLW